MRDFPLDQLFLDYHPRLCTKTGAFTAVEALVRWAHPERGTVYPSDFLPLLEDTPEGAAVDAWILATACAQASAWHKAGWPVCISVNIAPVQLDSLLRSDAVSRALSESQLPSQLLELEITEGRCTRPLTEQDSVSLRVLQAKGVKIVLDDFGVGWSSLSRLRKIPFDILKLDRSFVEGIPDNLPVIKVLVEVAHALNIQVVAEGVETPEQLAMIEQLNCDQLQGYYIGRPASAGVVFEKARVQGALS